MRLQSKMLQICIAEAFLPIAPVKRLDRRNKNPLEIYGLHKKPLVRLCDAAAAVERKATRLVKKVCRPRRTTRVYPHAPYERVSDLELESTGWSTSLTRDSS